MSTAPQHHLTVGYRALKPITAELRWTPAEPLEDSYISLHVDNVEVPLPTDEEFLARLALIEDELAKSAKAEPDLGTPCPLAFENAARELYTEIADRHGWHTAPRAIDDAPRDILLTLAQVGHEAATAYLRGRNLPALSWVGLPPSEQAHALNKVATLLELGTLQEAHEERRAALGRTATGASATPYHELAPVSHQADRVFAAAALAAADELLPYRRPTRRR